MNENEQPVYGVLKISAQIARRMKKEWEAVECPPRPPMRLTPEVLPFPPIADHAKKPRPLAA